MPTASPSWRHSAKAWPASPGRCPRYWTPSAPAAASNTPPTASSSGPSSSGSTGPCSSTSSPSNGSPRSPASSPGSAQPARVADIGCGSGWSSITIAQAYRLARVIGVDLDEASISQASKNAAASGVADRVTFHVADAADPQLTGTFDLVCAFETIHDMNDPTAALAAMRVPVAA